MAKRASQWDQKMDKQAPLLVNLVNEYLSVCRIENKTPKTLQGYKEKLSRFCRHLGPTATLADFNLQSARGYIAELQSTTKYIGHPYTPANGQPISATTIKGHAVVLKGFGTWLSEEGYTLVNVLARLQTPKAPTKVIPSLTEEEIAILFSLVDQQTLHGCRDATILMVLLDTGIRCAELLGITDGDLYLDDRCMKVMGKGQKERIVPFGDRTLRSLLRYLNRRYNPRGHKQVFLNLDGRPMTENAIKMVFTRLAKRSRIARLNIHLCRHTMATRYLLAGGDPLTLQRILGHETLEMTRRYLDTVQLETAMRRERLSPVDRLDLRKRHQTG